MWHIVWRIDFAADELSRGRMAEDWLDIRPGGKKLTKDQTRAPNMRKSALGKARIWASDGEYVYFRRAKSNPETLKRHEAFIRTGDYRHVQTQDDVEIYQLMPSSPFARPQKDLTVLDNYNVRREAALSACRRDWATFLDALSELSGRIKGQFHDAFARTVYEDNLTAIFLAINMRGGPSQTEIDREVKALRTRRGDDRKRLLVLPVGIAA